jgi:DNA-binding CsgD family transcriptional regulator
VADEGVARRLEAELIWLSSYYPETYPLGRERLARHHPEDCGDDLAGRQLLGLLASAAARAGELPSDALKLAQSALAGGVLLREHRTPAFTVPVSVLVYLDRFDEALAVYGDALDRARRTGSAFLFVMISVLRSALRLRRGELAEAEADAHDAVAAGAEYGSWAQPVTLLADVLIEQGDAAAAVEAFDRARPEQLPNAWELCFLESRRGRLRILQGRLREGVEDLLTAGERLRSLGCVNPAYAAWRSEAALALARLDQHDRALALAREEVELARVWKAPRTLGKALCSAGLVEPGDTGLERLHEAVAVLADSPAVLERARALTELGAALRRTNQRAAAREHLRAGLELAERCGARLLAERARDELVATGARPRRAARTGAEALTPSERRVARLAAGGQTNRAIAQALFVTPKTVQVHLSHAYQKLGVRSRSQLEGALRMAADERAGRSE